MPRRNGRKQEPPRCPNADEHDCEPCPDCGAESHLPGYDLPVDCRVCGKSLTIEQAERYLGWR